MLLIFLNVVAFPQTHTLFISQSIHSKWPNKSGKCDSHDRHRWKLTKCYHKFISLLTTVLAAAAAHFPHGKVFLIRKHLGRDFYISLLKRCCIRNWRKEICLNEKDLSKAMKKLVSFFEKKNKLCKLNICLLLMLKVR